MSCDCTPHVGDVDTELVAELVACDPDDDSDEGTPIDVSTASVLYIYLTSPAGVTTRKVAVLDTTGTDGKIRYNTVAGDLSAEGIWRMQGYAEVGARKFSGSETTFEVKASRHASYVP